MPARADVGVPQPAHGQREQRRLDRRLGGLSVRAGDELVEQPLGESVLQRHRRPVPAGRQALVVSLHRPDDGRASGVAAERIEAQDVVQQAADLALEAIELGQASSRSESRRFTGVSRAPDGERELLVERAGRSSPSWWRRYSSNWSRITSSGPPTRSARQPALGEVAARRVAGHAGASL